MKFINNLYTLIEIGINNNYNSEKLRRLGFLMNKKDTDRIIEEFEELGKFIPYCQWYIINNKNVLAMSAYIYDLYKDTGVLPDIENYDLEPSTEKLEHWQYINPYVIDGFYIITENMRKNLMKKSIKQSFIDVSFRCLPPGMSNYKY